MNAEKSTLPAKISAITWCAVIAAVVWAGIKRYRDIMQLPQLDRILGPVDPDPWLRLTQVRQLLSEGNFFDHLVHNTNSPTFGIATHWTRPMDILLAFFTRLTPAGLSLDTRLMLAGTWLPPLIGLIALWFIVRAGRKQFDHTHVLWCTVFLASVNPWMLYFAPGDTDHHGLLTMLWCGVLCVLAKPMQPRDGIFAGFLLGTMLWISPESLLLIAGIYALAGLDALRAPKQSLPLMYMTFAAAAVAWAGLFFEMPPSLIFAQISYDSLSLPYAVLMTLSGAGAGLLCWVSYRGASLKIRVQSVIASAAVMLVAMAWWFPKFFKGPMVDTDPFIQTDFLPFVQEAMPFHEQAGAAILVFSWAPLLALCLWLVTGRKRLLYGLLLVYTTAMMLASARWIYYVQPVAFIMIATLLPGWATLAKPKFMRWLKALPKLSRPYLFLAPIVFVVAALALQLPVTTWKGVACNAETRYVVQSGQLQGLLGKKPLTVYASSDISGQMLFFTPYKIIAGNYHREGKGLKALKEIFDQSKPDAARKKLQERKVDAMLVCPSEYPEKSWISQLGPKQHPAWLQPVSGLHFAKKDGAKPELFLLR